MKNAMEQTRPQSREPLEVIDVMQEEEVIAEQVRSGWATKKQAIIQLTATRLGKGYHEQEQGLERLNRDLWSILNAKADEEALSKLKSVNQGEGLWAYIRIHHWFSRTTDQGKNARRLAIMDPPQCKHDYEISQAIEDWEERYRILKDEDKESALPESWRMTALKKILCGDIKKHIELREEDIKSYDELQKIS